MHDRGALRGGAGGDEVDPPEGVQRAIQVEERVVEESEHELLTEQPAYRLINAGLGNLSGADQLDDQLWSALPAELVNPSIDGLLRTLERGEGFDSPARPTRAGYPSTRPMSFRPSLSR